MRSFIVGSLGRLLRHRLVLFLLVSGLNTLFGYGLFALLVYFGMHYTLAVFLATAAGILFNFKTIGRIVFKSRDNYLFFKFAAVYFTGYLCNIGGIALLGKMGVNPYYSGAIMTLPVALLTFMLNRTFVFKQARAA